MTAFQPSTDGLKFAPKDARALAEEARERKDSLRDATWDLLNLLTRLLDIGVSKEPIAEALGALIEPISEADDICNRVIEEIKEWFDPIDLNEARAMREGLRV